MIVKYLLLAGIIYVVYKYFDLAQKLGEGKSKPKIQKPSKEEGGDFVEYEELED
jgi:hypothetical protein